MRGGGLLVSFWARLLGSPFVTAGMDLSGVEVRKWGDRGPGCLIEGVPCEGTPTQPSGYERNELSIWSKKTVARPDMHGELEPPGCLGLAFPVASLDCHPAYAHHGSVGQHAAAELDPQGCPGLP